MAQIALTLANRSIDDDNRRNAIDVDSAMVYRYNGKFILGPRIKTFSIEEIYEEMKKVVEKDKEELGPDYKLTKDRMCYHARQFQMKNPHSSPYLIQFATGSFYKDQGNDDEEYAKMMDLLQKCINGNCTKYDSWSKQKPTKKKKKKNTNGTRAGHISKPKRKRKKMEKVIAPKVLKYDDYEAAICSEVSDVSVVTESSRGYTPPYPGLNDSQDENDDPMFPPPKIMTPAPTASLITTSEPMITSSTQSESIVIEPTASLITPSEPIITPSMQSESTSTEQSAPLTTTTATAPSAQIIAPSMQTDSTTIEQSAPSTTTSTTPSASMFIPSAFSTTPIITTTSTNAPVFQGIIPKPILPVIPFARNEFSFENDDGRYSGIPCTRPLKKKRKLKN